LPVYFISCELFRILIQFSLKVYKLKKCSSYKSCFGNSSNSKVFQIYSYLYKVVAEKSLGYIFIYCNSICHPFSLVIAATRASLNQQSVTKFIPNGSSKKYFRRITENNR
jgi:hypothetical protein